VAPLPTPQVFPRALEQGQGGGDVVVPPFLVGQLDRPPVLHDRQPLPGLLRLPLGLRLPVPGEHRLVPQDPERRPDPPAEQGQHRPAPPPPPPPCPPPDTPPAHTPPTAATPAPARRPGNAARPPPGRWHSRSAASGSSPAPSSRSSPARRAAALSAWP